MMSDEEASTRNIEPMGAFKGWAVAGCEPDEMGIGPIYAVPKLLKRHGLTVDDIDIWELNEAFASQCLYSPRHSSASTPRSTTSTAARSRSATLRYDGHPLRRPLSSRKASAEAPSGASSRCASAAARARPD